MHSEYDARRIMRNMGAQARKAARTLAGLPAQQRANAIQAMPDVLLEARDSVLDANQQDLQAARQAGISGPLLKRLELSSAALDSLAAKLRKVAALPDPVGRTLQGHVRPDGLQVRQISVPIGVIGIIYESRPNVTTDAASVCLKSGNTVILRGGSEAIRTNIVLANAMIQAAVDAGLPGPCIQMVRTTDRRAVGEMLALDDDIDVIIPRGGKSLIDRIARESRIPVIKHYDGICHIYVAEDAPEAMAIEVAVNSKCQRMEVCNALETLLLDAACADRLLPSLVAAFAEAGVTCRGCAQCRAIVPHLEEATEKDWSTEYLAPILSVKIVGGIEQAIDHINTYGSGHTDGIVTRRLDLADRFTTAVDSASVLVNASTRLSGGGAYGMGAVVGISTDKLHARGPVGPEQLTSTKWIAVGDGHLRG